MKRILVVGAGRSATSLIDYLLTNSEKNDWHITVADYDKGLAINKVNNHERGSAMAFDVHDVQQRNDAIRLSDIVVSMLPASMHILLAEDCIFQGKNMVTASYVSEEIEALNEKALEKGVIILNEIGLDPGIDHLSAKKIIDEIHNSGGEIQSFKSFCGGLVAPECDNNPWNYKFTWNPRNVVLAGQGNAQFIRNNKYKYIPYNSLFTRLEEMEILDQGTFEAYSNRDSLSYRKSYGIDNIPTIYRGTLRKVGYSEAWNVFVKLGMTDDTYKVRNVESLTWREFINSFLVFHKSKTVEQKLIEKLSIDDKIIDKLRWLGILDDELVGMPEGTPAQILQKLLESKWSLEKNDKDMVIMQHHFSYTLAGKKENLKSSLVIKGKDQLHTAMSMTVGLPVAIATELILKGEISLTGVKIPTDKEIYLPVLEKLKEYGIDFVEESF